MPLYMSDGDVDTTLTCLQYTDEARFAYHGTVQQYIGAVSRKTDSLLHGSCAHMHYCGANGCGVLTTAP